jgi:hypothetical protein
MEMKGGGMLTWPDPCDVPARLFAGRTAELRGIHAGDAPLRDGDEGRAVACSATPKARTAQPQVW